MISEERVIECAEKYNWSKLPKCKDPSMISFIKSFKGAAARVNYYYTTGTFVRQFEGNKALIRKEVTSYIDLDIIFNFDPLKKPGIILKKSFIKDLASRSLMDDDGDHVLIFEYENFN